MASTTGRDAEAPQPLPEKQPPAEKARRGPVASVFSAVGELMITVGLLLGLFVVYSLWWTNVTADKEAHRQAQQVRRHWAQTPPAGDDGKAPPLDTKSGIGFLHVPSMKNGELLIKKGTAVSVLNQGVAGYYTSPVKSALPWDKTGNVTLAAHRDGHGAKFHNIDKVKVGDPVVVETRDTWYVYKVYKILPQTSKYDVNSIQQIPKESGRTKPGRYLTLTTCTPVYTSDYRYIVWSQLVRTQKVDSHRTPPPELR
ncbi:class E sortase [Streptomyces sp. 8L]|uniref:class E sortase n=1 Tax=Streptomyces sp. 8L TaxID=2877242 RepID=UPI001CD3D62C|nr:class E sortase [Streptomyces sp. 8L]MCA1222760.1 class E sortase [Streptomyces sp. 8L]